MTDNPTTCAATEAWTGRPCGAFIPWHRNASAIYCSERCRQREKRRRARRAARLNARQAPGLE